MQEASPAELESHQRSRAFALVAINVETMSDLRLFDTATGTSSVFDPGPVARIYVCGITPYDATHLGHAATYVTYDVLHRRLLDRGVEVRMVRNITDVDNDLFERARRDDVNYLDLAFGQKRVFDADLEALGVLEPWSEPRVTSAIPDIRGAISYFLSIGHAYDVDGWVYYRHSAVDSFGSVSGYSRVDMRTIGELRGENPSAPGKEHPLDTVLWQRSAEDEPSWEAPWGSGRPGWHIECTALAIRELGTIDLHGGGCDLVYPHHEFCAAQLESSGVAKVGHWMHQSCVHLRGEPMSKSTGNLIFVRDLTAEYEPMVVRLAVMSQNYRSTEWTWHDGLLDEAVERLALWRNTAELDSSAGLLDDVRECLDDDLNVPAAIELIDAGAAQGQGVQACAELLGVSLN